MHWINYSVVPCWGKHHLPGHYRWDFLAATTATSLRPDFGSKDKYNFSREHFYIFCVISSIKIGNKKLQSTHAFTL